MSRGSITVHMPDGREPLHLAINTASRVHHVLAHIAKTLAEPQSNVMLTARGQELAHDLRLVALPPGHELTCRLRVARAPPDPNAPTPDKKLPTPRLVPMQKLHPRMHVMVSQEGSHARRVNVFLDEPINQVRRLCKLSNDPPMQLTVDGSIVVDERRTVRDLMVKEGASLHYVPMKASSALPLAMPGYDPVTRPSRAELSASFQYAGNATAYAADDVSAIHGAVPSPSRARSSRGGASPRRCASCLRTQRTRASRMTWRWRRIAPWCRCCSSWTTQRRTICAATACACTTSTSRF